MVNSNRTLQRTPIQGDFMKLETDLVQENRLALLKKIHVELKRRRPVPVHVNGFQVRQTLDKLGPTKIRKIDGQQRNRRLSSSE